MACFQCTTVHLHYARLLRPVLRFLRSVKITRIMYIVRPKSHTRVHTIIVNFANCPINSNLDISELFCDCENVVETSSVVIQLLF